MRQRGLGSSGRIGEGQSVNERVWGEGERRDGALSKKEDGH